MNRVKWPGEKEAWDLLANLDPYSVQKNAQTVFEPDQTSFLMACFGQTIQISLRERSIRGQSQSGKFLIHDLGGYSRLSILRYLVHAKDISLTQILVKPSDLQGGEIFVQGTHVLPLKDVAKKFDHRQNDFLERGEKLGGTQMEYGDVSLQLFPFPKVPLVMILWKGDEEFPPNASVLFDASTASFLPTDILWSTAMMTIEMMLNFNPV